MKKDYDVFVPENKRSKKSNNKTVRTKKTSKSNIIEEEDVVFSRVKNKNYRQKDKNLESLINEINKDHRPIEEDDEYLDINNKEEELEELEVKDNKEIEETIVLPKYTKKEEIYNIKPTTKKKKKKYRIKKRAVALVLFILLVSIGSITAFVIYHNKQKRLEDERIRKENYIKEVNSHYSNLVRTNKDTMLYKKVNNNYQAAGMLYKDNVISIKKEDYDENTKYFYSEDMDLYISYQDVDPNKEELVIDERYKNYIPFNENIVTKDEYIIYHENNNKYYKLTESTEYPIIIKDTDKYYFEFEKELVYVLKTDVKETKKATNTKKYNVSNVPVLNYHFIYDPKERTCNQSICLTASRFEEHLKYFKDNNILDLTMREFELYMDKKINLPKSVLVTLDDGWLMEKAVEVLDANKFHATYFLVTSWYAPIKSEYVEYHSHSHNMHNQGVCKTGQGGGIQCLSESKIQEDLKASRDRLNNTTIFCYPFYEWNDYAISQLKKAGFTLAFIGGQRGAKPSDNHYRVPRYVIYSWTTVSTLKGYFK